jgi:hypothetical protein
MTSLSSFLVPCIQVCFEHSSPARPTRIIFPVTAPAALRSGEGLSHPRDMHREAFQAVTRDAGIKHPAFE